MEGSVAVTGIRRAKGNEWPMVYVLDGEYCYAAPDVVWKRNSLFTAITRARAWIRICGVGRMMEELAAEIEKSRAHQFQLDFSVPTLPELERMRKIQRDRTADEKQLISTTSTALDRFISRVDAGELSFDDLPEEIRDKLLRLFGRQSDG